ncbi:MAG: glycoside hydrolase family 3 C-terminal domain-containing protein [Clostridia bacterium]|nr:glycoside hydrolase family 3 C-terminal domain-containing protein [Clostridia bacterium]
MTNFLVNMVSPILTPMGVSKADLAVYIEAISGKLLIGGAALLALIAVLIGAHWIKKGWKAFVRAQAVVVFLLVLVLLVNSVCYNAPIYGPLSTFLNASAIEINEELSSASLSITERIGAEGFVLLKNDGDTLPLSSSTKKINVFGWASTQPYLGGTGSSAGSNEDACGILDSLQRAGYETNQTLTDLYTAYAAERPGADMFGQNMTLPEPTAAAYTDSILSEAKAFSDTALVVIARGGGENYDLPIDMHAVIHGAYNIAEKVSNSPEVYPYTKVTYTNNGDYDDFDAGESYLELSNTEEAMLGLVCESFDKVILVVNSCNPMELGFVNDYPIDAVIYAPAAGAQGFAALGEILSGNINPSGRTADTWVYDLLDTPTIHNVGINAYTNVDDVKAAVLAADATYQGSMSFVNYVEGIYTGYKFYETAAEEGLIDYDAVVQYPFGYGLSYTSFTEEITSFSEERDTLRLTVKVTNTGSRAGRDVVELYYTAPYTNGGIEKAAANLLDFEKTESLSAGESQTVTFTVNKEDLASYDSEGVKLPGGGYILQAGEYSLSIRTDSHHVADSRSFTVDADIAYNETGRASDQTAAVNQFESYARGTFTQLSRANGFANYAEAVAAPASAELSDADKEAVAAQLWGFYDENLYQNGDDAKPNSGKKNGLTLADMTGKDYDDPDWEKLLDQTKAKDLLDLVYNGGWKTAELRSIGKVATNDSDGPAGLNNYITGSSGTTFPAEILMAQTWSKEVASLIGTTMGQEFASANNYGWYGPAMNLHRSAFAGRNFEYYSEDAMLSAIIATCEANGAAQYGVYPYLKHFAMNDQELGRTAILLTFASEQAIREVYLKPFEYTVKHFSGKALAMMSSYNFIGTKYAGANPELLQTVLRAEWGFRGMVETDYDGSYGYMITDAVIRNGGDLMLGYGSYATNELSTKKATTLLNLRRAAKNILYTVANSGYYGVGLKDATSPEETEEVQETEAPPVETAAPVVQESGVNNMDALFRKINLTAAAILIALEAIIILCQLRGKKGKRGSPER